MGEKKGACLYENFSAIPGTILDRPTPPHTQL